MISIKDLSVSYKQKINFFRTVELKVLENINLNIDSNQVIGLVGESGSGKSTLAKAIVGLTQLTGEIQVDDFSLQNLKKKDYLSFRKKVQLIFQNPHSSLNPKMTIRSILYEVLDVHFSLSYKQKELKVKEILQSLKLKDTILDRYAHEFSGGQKQRISIARALILNPNYIICDEITSALDVSTQAQILNLLIDLKNKNSLSYLFISHNLAVVHYISDIIIVMYLGEIIEFIFSRDYFSKPAHPYTYFLFQANFDIYSKKKKQVLKGEIPSLVNKPTSCYFYSRCPIAKEICKIEKPKWKYVNEKQKVLCHFPLSIK